MTQKAKSILWDVLKIFITGLVTCLITFGVFIAKETRDNKIEKVKQSEQITAIQNDLSEIKKDVRNINDYLLDNKKLFKGYVFDKDKIIAQQ